MTDLIDKAHKKKEEGKEAGITLKLEWRKKACAVERSAPKGVCVWRIVVAIRVASFASVS